MLTANYSNARTLDLIDKAVAWLRERIPEDWSVERARELGSDRATQAMVDSLIELGAPHVGGRTIAVEERQSFSPRDAEMLLPQLTQSIRSISGNPPLLVVAPWLSERSQQALAERSVNFLDETGNALLRLDNPALFIQATGATRNPKPRIRGQAQATGSKAARLIRLLAEVCPPYGVRELAAAADLAPGYVSQLLGTLYRETLIERGTRGPVESVEVGALLRRWVQSYDVFETNHAYTYIAPRGFEDLLERFVEQGLGDRLVLTGSIAARRLAPVTVSAMVMAYCDDPSDVAQGLDLLPADEGANAVLLEPFDPVVWKRTTRIENGLRFAAPSQVAVDCLSGNGRMPAEGEALLTWMLSNESSWRLPSLAELNSGSP